MTAMIERMRSLLVDEEGLTTVEYALLLALIAIASIGAWQALGSTKTKMTVESVATYMQTP